MEIFLSSGEVDPQFFSPEPHPDTIELAKKLIDELQTSTSYSKCAAKVPKVPPFLATPIPQKISVEQLFGSSDSEAVSDFDYRNGGGGESDSFEDEAKSPEELYSEENSHHSDSGDSTGSNYESTSSFEERKRKAQNRRSHGSATSKAAAAGRKKKMQDSRARALENSPQSIYAKNRAPSKRKAPATPDSSQNSSCSETQSDEKGSGHGGS